MRAYLRVTDHMGAAGLEKDGKAYLVGVGPGDRISYAFRISSFDFGHNKGWQEIETDDDAFVRIAQAVDAAGGHVSPDAPRTLREVNALIRATLKPYIDALSLKTES